MANKDVSGLYACLCCDPAGKYVFENPVWLAVNRANRKTGIDRIGRRNEGAFRQQRERAWGKLSEHGGNGSLEGLVVVRIENGTSVVVHNSVPGSLVEFGIEVLFCDELLYLSEHRFSL